MRAGSLTVEKIPSELVFQQLDGTGQCRLGNVAFLGRTGEVQLLAQSEEIPDLMHFHGGGLPVMTTTRPGGRSTMARTP